MLLNEKTYSSGIQTIARQATSLRAIALVVTTLICSVVFGQQDPVHYFHRANLPPGVVGQGQLLLGGQLRNYYQPVEVHVPEGGTVSLAVCGRFEAEQPGPVLAGMLIGQVYRLKISRIPRNEGMEVFPTIEVINRLYPPPGLDRHFPIPVHFTRNELELALSGQYVTRVVYLENPSTALAVQDEPTRHRYYEIRPDEDPLQVADRLGRPMAIIRMGSRVPSLDQVSQRFLFDCPPLVRLERPEPIPDARSALETPISVPGMTREGTIPRVPLSPGYGPGYGSGYGQPGWPLTTPQTSLPQGALSYPSNAGGY